MKARGVMLVVARNTLNFIHEMKAGELLRIETAFIRVGEKSCTHLNRMYNVDTGTLTATLESVEVFFDPVARLSAPMPDDIRALLTDALVTVDDG
jgi:acyl-CoA thioesterase FadM